MIAEGVPRKVRRPLKVKKIYLRPRMRFIVDVLEPLHCDVSVDLSCGEVHVTQELLDASQVRASIQ